MGVYLDKSITHETQALIGPQARLEVHGGSRTLNVSVVLECPDPIYANVQTRVLLEPAAVCRLIGELTQIAVSRGWMAEQVSTIADRLKIAHDMAGLALDSGRNEQDVLADLLASISLLMAVPS